MCTLRLRTVFFNVLFIVTGVTKVYSLEEVGSNPKEFLRLKDYLQSQFDFTLRPVKKLSTTTKVNLFFMVNHISEVNDLQQTITLSASVSMFWQNELLKWDPKDYSNISILVLDDWKIWIPDIKVNSFQRTFMSSYRRNLDGVSVYNYGLNFYNFLTEAKIPCKFDYYNFPKDIQSCTIAIFSFTYHLSEMDFNFHNNQSAVVYLSGLDQSKAYVVGWKFLKIEQSKTYASVNEYDELIYSTNPKTDTDWPVLLVKLTLIRHRPYFIVIEITSFILTAILTVSVFWVENENFYISISVINILLQAIISWGVLIKLPSSESSIPKIIIIYGIHIGLTSMAFFISMLLSSVSNWTVKLPVSFEIVVNKLTMNNFCNPISLQHHKGIKPDKELGYGKAVYKNLLKLISRSFFVLYSSIYIILLAILLS